MSDRGHELTDDMIEELEKRLEREYSRAYKDVARKTKAYFDKFKADDEAMKARVDAGEVTREYWLQWRYNHMMTGKRWIEMRDTLAEDLKNVDSKARSIIGEHTPEAYALNHNYATFQVEKDSLLNTSYTLYNREAVENILRDDPKLLPYPRTESKTARELRERADLIWNRQKLNNEITQGILQGEPIRDIAKRLQRVVGMDGRAALRNARTMMTSAENKGREDAYDALEEKGVELDRQWVATLDDRTRHSHRLLHGEIKDRNTGLYSNGLKYPADPDGDPAEVYNCRCSEIATVTGFPIDIPKLSPKMGDMTFEEWLGIKENAKTASAFEHVVVTGKDISDSFSWDKEKYDFEIDAVLDAQGFNGLPRIVREDEFNKYVEKSGIICKRGYRAPDEETLKMYQNSLYHGKWYVDCSKGGAAFGQGMYSVGAYGNTLSQRMQDDVDSYGKNGIVETFTLENPRLINHDDIGKERWRAQYEIYRGAVHEELTENQEILFRLMCNSPLNDEEGKLGWSLLSNKEDVKIVSELKNKAAQDPEIKPLIDRTLRMNDGAFAAMRGYDAMQVDINNQGDKYFIILNRTKCIFKE